MRKRIEVVSLAPAMDPLTMQPKSSLVLRYKTEGGTFEQLELEGSQKAILDMLKIDNFSDIAGQKLDVDVEVKEGKMRIMGFALVDSRQISYQEFENMRNAIHEMHSIIKAFASQSGQTVQQTYQPPVQTVPNPSPFSAPKQG